MRTKSWRRPFCPSYPIPSNKGVAVFESTTVRISEEVIVELAAELQMKPAANDINVEAEVSWDHVCRAKWSHPDPTAAAAASPNVQRGSRVASGRAPGENWRSPQAPAGIILARTRAFIEKTPEPMRPLRPPKPAGQFRLLYQSGTTGFKELTAVGP